MKSPEFSRREFLKTSFAAIVTLAIPQTSFAEVLQPKISLRESKNAQGQNTDLFPDAFKRFIIDFNGKPVASFFTIETHSSRSTLSFVPNTIDPHQVMTDKNTVFVFAGPFTNKQGQTEGKAFIQGKEIGEQVWNPRFEGVLCIDENGKPKILTSTEAQTPLFQKQAQEKHWSFFQQFLLIHQGKQTDRSKNKMLQAAKKWRFFIRRSDQTHGILDFSDTSLTLNQAIHIAMQAGAEEALFLDMGASSLGLYKAKDGVFPFYDANYKLSTKSPGGYLIGSVN